MLLGVTVAICCHNSADELPQTLAHLAAQQVSAEIPWEVIVIDNASSDRTAQVALELWPTDAPAPLRVVVESKLGLINARYRALAEARYELISFIDDDNWVCPEWVQLASETMSNHPELGACGGLNLPEFKGTPPEWFELSEKSYAVGPQGPDQGGDITWTRGRLIGAGLTIRKTAWQQLLAGGFRSLLVGSKGKALYRGEDTELCFALVLAGWNLWYEPRMTLRHHLAADRLTWQHLRKIRRGGGRSTLGLDPYRVALQQKSQNMIQFWWQSHPKLTWLWQVYVALRFLLKRPRKVVLSMFKPMEGDSESLRIESTLGRLLELLQMRHLYDLNIQNVMSSAWQNRELAVPQASRETTPSHSV